MTLETKSVYILPFICVLSACNTVSSGPVPAIGGLSLSAEECANVYRAVTSTGQPSEQFCKSAQSLVGQTSEGGIATDQPIEYSDTPAFSAILSRSILSFPTKTISVKFTSVPLNIADFRDAKPPYTSTAINTWLAAVERGGGKVCEVETSNAFLVPFILKLGITVGSQLLNRLLVEAKTADLYRPATSVDALVKFNRVDVSAPGSGRITTVQFIPKNKALKCNPPEA